MNSSFLESNGYNFIRLLGKGGFGIVGLYEKNGQKYAIKILDIENLIEREMKKHNTTYTRAREGVLALAYKEIKNLEKIKKTGPAICGNYLDFILTYDVLVDNLVPFFYLISEPMSDDLMGFFLGKKGCLVRDCPQSIISGLSENRDELIIAVICQIVYAIYCLHQIGIVHGDIKPANIFIDGQTGQIKIADFGGSAWLGNGEIDETMKIIGSETLHFVPPERFGQNRPVTPKIDVWAIGATILLLVTNDPKVVLKQYLANLPQSEINTIIEEQVEMSDESTEQWTKWLLRSMLERDPLRRTGLHNLIFDTRFDRQCRLPVKNIIDGTGHKRPKQIPIQSTKKLSNKDMSNESVVIDRPKSKTIEEILQEFEKIN